MPRVAVAIAHVRIAVESIFLVHEGARILPYLIANTRVVAEIILQCRMVAHKFRIVQQGRVLAHLFGDFAVSIEEAVEIRHVPLVAIPAGVTIAHVGVAVEGIFLVHEGPWILTYLVANTGVIPVVSFQSRMVPQEIPIVEQGRIFANLFGNFAVFIQELIETRHVSAIAASVEVSALASLPFLLGRCLRLRGGRLRVRGSRET
jgi:hypothetical protein